MNEAREVWQPATYNLETQKSHWDNPARACDPENQGTSSVSLWVQGPRTWSSPVPEQEKKDAPAQGGRGWVMPPTPTPTHRGHSDSAATSDQTGTAGT